MPSRNSAAGLSREAINASTAHWKAMIAQIDKYGAKLFADPIPVQTPHGSLLIQPKRTNNILERFFGISGAESAEKAATIL